MHSTRFCALVVPMLLYCGLLIEPSTGWSQTTTFVPKAGFVPTANTAIVIAEAVLEPIYGKAQIEGERPLQAHLSGEIWIVTGTLKSGGIGGVAMVRISKKTGTILSVIHGK